MMINLEEITEVPTAPLTSIPNDVGYSRPAINSTTAGSKDIYASVYRLDPYQYHPRHYHPHASELYYVLEGRCKIELDDRCEWAEKSTFVFIPPGTFHSARTEDEGVSLLVIFPFGDWSKAGMVWDVP